MVESLLQYQNLLVLHSPNLHQLFILTWSIDATWRFVSSTYIHAWVTMVRKKWLSLFFSAYWWYIHQTCTNCLSCHDLLIPGDGLSPWPLFHAWVTMVRKKWLSLYYSTFWCYINQTCTNYSFWHDLLMLHSGLCPWRTFRAWVTTVRKKIMVMSILQCLSATFTKLTPTVYQYLDMILYWCHAMVCVIDLRFTLECPRHKMTIAGPLWWLPSQ